jgi:hypothetical protein
MPSARRAQCWLLASAFYLLLPSTMYWHQNVYFADQAVLLPWIAAIALEVTPVPASRRMRLAKELLVAVVVFAGCLTEWLFLFIVPCLVLGRFWRAEGPVHARVRETLVPIGAAAIAFILYALQIAHFNQFVQLYERFAFRTSVTGEGQAISAMFVQNFWKTWMLSQYRPIGRALIALSVIASIPVVLSSLRTRRLLPGFTAFALVVPPVLHTLALRNHATVHQFSVQKFAPVLALIPFIVIPAVLASSTKASFKVRRTIIWAALICGLATIHTLHRHWRFLFQTDTVAYRELANYVSQRATENNLFYSPTYSIDANPPEPLSLTMKRVYRAATLRIVAERALPFSSRGLDEVYVLFSASCRLRVEELAAKLGPDAATLEQSESAILSLRFSPPQLEQLNQNERVLDAPLCVDGGAHLE